jgi:hypothetical protein
MRGSIDAVASRLANWKRGYSIIFKLWKSMSKHIWDFGGSWGGELFVK